MKQHKTSKNNLGSFRIAIKTCLKRIEESSLRICQIIPGALSRLYRPIELFTQIRMKQIRGYDSAYPKLKDLEVNLRIEYRNYVRKGDKLFLGWIIGFLNQNYGDFRKFWRIFYKMAEMKYLLTGISVFLYFYIPVIPIFDNHINPCKI